MTIGSLATATLEAGSVVVVTGFVVVVVDFGFVVVVVPPTLVVVVTGWVVVVTGLVVVVTAFVVVVTAFVVVVTAFVVVVTAFVVVVVTGFVVVVVGGVGGAGGVVTVTLPGVPVMNGTGWPADQPTWSISIVLVVVRKATVAESPFTRMLARPLAAVAPVIAERSVATNGRHAP
jgi:hypothetical protein